MKILSYSFLAALAASGFASAQSTATTNPVGYTTITCPVGSDTVVGLPLRQPAVSAGVLSAAPSVTGNSATLSVTNGAFTANEFANTHYVRIKSGTSDGKVLPVTSNTANSIVVDLNGGTLSAAQSDIFEVVKFWTLAELINPATATDNPSTTTNAVVVSSSIAPAGRRTEILVPNLSGAGINLAPTTTYFIHGGIWKKQGGVNTSFNTDQLWPDSYFIVRNPATLAASTKFIASGEVTLGKFSIPLSTQSNSKQDNFVAIPRPIDVAIKDLGLTTDVFVASTSIAPAGRQDELLVYDNLSSAINKSPSATYFFHSGIWKKQGGVNVDFGGDVIPAGGGFIIRKAQTANGSTVFWNNTATY